jgi:hypothetical protein
VSYRVEWRGVLVDEHGIGDLLQLQAILRMLCVAPAVRSCEGTVVIAAAGSQRDRSIDSARCLRAIGRLIGITYVILQK